MSSIMCKNAVTNEDYKRVLLGILKEVDRFCRDNGIVYYLTAGTLLGAIRHKGFIPWDDDIDICMKRKDYETFCSSFRSDYEYYELLTLNNSKDYYSPTAKIIDKRITVREHLRGVCEIGAYIDLFPMDYLNCSYEDAARYMEKDSFYSRIGRIGRIEIDKKRPFYKNFLIRMARIVYPFTLRQDAWRKDKSNKRITSMDRTELIANLYGAWGKREVSKSEFFDDTVEVMFEGYQYLAPVGYDQYLSGLYGDYMKLPPPEKRISHHAFDAYWA